MKKFGITLILASLMAVVRLTKKVDGALEDKHISPMEWGEIGIAAFQFGWTFTKIKEMKEEFNDMDAEERTELIQKFAAELELRNEDAEQLVEKIFAVLISLTEIFKKTA